MDSVDRRSLLIGAGLTAALSGCSGPKETVCPPPKEGRACSKSIDPNDNNGEYPWKWRPGDPKPSTGRVKFNPTKICLIYINIAFDPVKLEIAKFHFPNSSGGSEWEDIKNEVCDLINRVNKEASFPPGYQSSTPIPMPDPNQYPVPASHLLGDTHDYWAGLKDFAFSQQHHIVIYIRNGGVGYHDLYPVMFGKKLQSGMLGVGKNGDPASLNQSFYDADHYDMKGFIDPGGLSRSTVVLHMKNYYQVLDNGIYRLIRNDINNVKNEDRIAYSLNINALVKSTYDPLDIPIVIDPDTGNMGEGRP